jgi:RND family efflux transporter MFP subunit
VSRMTALQRRIMCLSALTALLVSPMVGAVLPEDIPAPGVTQALREVKLSMTAAGRVEGLFVREGDRVRKGDLLIHLDRTTEELEVQRRRLMLEDAARLEELRLREQTLGQQVALARALFESGGLSRKQLEDEELGMRSVTAERQMLEAAKRREQVELSLSQEAYERRHLRAPFNGVVTKVGYRVGESVAPHEPVIVLVDVSRVRFLSAVAPAAAAKLRNGQRVDIQLGQGVTTTDRRAQVVFVAPTADPSSGLIEVIAEFDNANGSVRPGVTGHLILGPGPGGQTLPVTDRNSARKM